MNPTSGVKRARESSHDSQMSQAHQNKAASPTVGNATATSATAFRNVSACHRCRLRKNRCDQKIPACTSCEKAGVKCVGYDPITKKEIPRSYVYYLETRVEYLESLLQNNSITYQSAEELVLGTSPASNPTATPASSNSYGATQGHKDGTIQKRSQTKSERDKLNKLVSNIGFVSVQGASEQFAKVVFSAVRHSISGTSSDRGNSLRPHRSIPGAATTGGGTSMRDSFFGLHRKPTIDPAPFPPKDIGLRLIELYFEHANPQIPILHRGEFEELVRRVYNTDEKNRTPRELYMLNIVFAIGAGIILKAPDPNSRSERSTPETPLSPTHKRRKVEGVQHQPEEYHAAAFVHLESFLGSSPATDRPEGFGAGLEELQAVLLLAGFALLRPVPPGLWYIVGVAVRLAIDLGLHYEDGVGIERPSLDEASALGTRGPSADAQMAEKQPPSAKVDAKEKGRREWVRDLRRRVWWCVYSFDRLVSTCVGRPLGIGDSVITTEFPSLLDDTCIRRSGFIEPPSDFEPSYKFVAKHYFRLRLIQSEILEVLQYRQAQQARVRGANEDNIHMHTKLPCPFLQGFDTFKAWRADIDLRLEEWRHSAPTRKEFGVGFDPLFFELNYWQTVIMIYRQGLTVPAVLSSELGTEASSPTSNFDDQQDNEESVFLKVADAGREVLDIYKRLHKRHLVNYTFLATHHLFLAGISFLYAIWHSAAVRDTLSQEKVSDSIQAATTVLADLSEKCPPAEACKDALQRMARATIKMTLSTTGFGIQPVPKQHRTALSDRQSVFPASEQTHGSDMKPPKVPIPRFETNFNDLFSDHTMAEPVSPNFSRSGQGTQRNTTLSIPTGGVVKNEPTTLSPEISPMTTVMPSSYPLGGGQNVPMNFANIASQQQQAQMQDLYSPTYPSSTNQQSLQQQQFDYSTYPAAANAQNPSFNSPIYSPSTSDLDFLGPYSAQDRFAPTAGTPTGAVDPATGADVGFSFMGVGAVPGFDGHDWADGSGYDIMDGFFFGS